MKKSDEVAVEKLSLESVGPNLERFQELRELYPEAFVEGKIDVDKFRQVLGQYVETGPERYGLTWAGKSDAIKSIQSLSTGTLLPCRDESINFDSTENVIIEGDNLEVLKLLQRNYYGKIKMIYIDPPYNTGGEFIYPDNYREGLQEYLRFSGQISGEGIKLTTNPETSGRYHSRWLTMMYPRLFLARNLLREDGVIFVSIDDHEVHNLRLTMNEIFGEENLIESFVWKKSYGGGAKEQFAVRQHEYCLFYARNGLALDELWLPPDPEAEKKYYKYRDENFEKRGPFRIKPLEATKSMDERANLVFPIPAPDGTLVYPKRQWWWSQERVTKSLANNGLVFTKTDEGYSVSYKQYLIKENGEKRGIKPFSVIDGIYTQHGTDDLRKIFDDEVVVQFPKPVALISKFLQIGTDEDSMILDFFAGSGTTAQAVLELNRQDIGNRKFILVQLPEPSGRKDYDTIADIAKERGRRVIKNLNSADSQDLPAIGAGKPDRGFQVFKLSSSNFKIWDSETAPKEEKKLAEQLKLMVHNVVENRSDDDLLYELILKSGLPLTSKIDEVIVAGVPAFNIEDGTLIVCLARPISRDALREIIALKPQRVLCLDVGFTGNDQLKTNIVLEMKSHGVEFRTV